MPKRLIFLYYSDGAAQPSNIPEYDAGAESQNKYAKQFMTDGLYYVFRRLIEKGTLTEVLIVTESTRSPGRVKTDFPGIQNIVIPHISVLDGLLREDDLIFTRGGFRGWHDWLVEKQAAGYWTWLYAANTGRQRWPFWDLILEDTHNWDDIGRTDRHGRHHLDYRKPVNPEYFFPCPDTPKYEYDFMIGASYITDKKGQWRTVQALRTFRDNFGYSPRCVMPGAVRRGTKTNKMLERLAKDDLNIVMPGMLDRAALAVLMRKTKVFIHSGASGQNDRGPLEAMACGCRLVLNAPQYHHPLLSSPSSLTVTCNCNDLKNFVDILSVLQNQGEEGHEAYRKEILAFFDRTHGVERVVIPDFEKILIFFDAYPKRSYDGKEALSYALK